jgi:integrase
MASVFKLRITRYVGPDGKRTKKGTPGARRVKEKSRKWYGEYVDPAGLTHRVPLAADKTASQAMLTDLVRQAERRASGLFDPFEEHSLRRIEAHISDYHAFCLAKGTSATHARLVQGRLNRAAKGCGFKKLAEVDANKLASWLAEQRRTSKRFSNQTSNFYLDCFKSLCNWLVEHERLPRNPLASLKRINVEIDRRHDRRSLTDDEFARLIAAAEAGKPVQGMKGPDRAMLYLMASWTGFRRQELASLTLASLALDAPTPVVRVKATFSKRRRHDTVPLHPFLVERLRTWIATWKQVIPTAPLFELRSACGALRQTSKMMRTDLKSARQTWIGEAADEGDRSAREQSDFLSYQDQEGLFADFHANRHTFISNLGRAGVPLAIAQKLARHSDPRLTASRYTHIELSDLGSAIRSLPTPREGGHSVSEPMTDSPEGQNMVAGMVAGKAALDGQSGSSPVTDTVMRGKWPTNRNSLVGNDFDGDRRRQSWTDKAPPAGIEPATNGLGNRCSIP